MKTVGELASDDKKISPIQKLQVKVCFKYIIWKNKPKQKDGTQLNDFVLTTQHIKMKSNHFAQEIKGQKENYSAAIRDHVDDALFYKYPDALIDIILQYTIELSKNIHEYKAQQKRSLHFFEHSTPVLNEETRQKAKLYARLMLFFYLLFANSENTMRDETIKLISDYAVTPKK